MWLEAVTPESNILQQHLERDRRNESKQRRIKPKGKTEGMGLELNEDVKMKMLKRKHQYMKKGDIEPSFYNII